MVRRAVLASINVVLLTAVVASCDGNPVVPDLQRRMEVVELAATGRLGDPAADFELVTLPAEYADLSEPGEVVVSREFGGLVVVFFTRRGVLDNYEGLVWAAPEVHLQGDPLGGNTVEFDELGDGWFRLAAN